MGWWDTSRAVVTGTASAVHWAHRHAVDHPDGHLFLDPPGTGTAATG